MPKHPVATVPVEIIEQKIYLIRGQKVMFDADLAALYAVETKVFNQAVRRNLDRFPDDFMFQLTKEETEFLTSQIAMSKGRGGRPHVSIRIHGAGCGDAFLRAQK